MIQFDIVRCDHDGVPLEGLAMRPPGSGPHPAVLVMHSALGIRTKVKQSVRALAELGYLAVATDMYGPAIQHDVDPKAVVTAYAALKDAPVLNRQRAVAWFDAVAALPDVDPRCIAAIGYCFGGECVLELARAGADLRAAVSYHGILTTHAPARPDAIKCEVAAYCGAKDPYAPSEHVEALRRELSDAGARHQIMVFSEAEHSFTDPEPAGTGFPGIAYHAVADRVSWAGTLALLETALTR